MYELCGGGMGMGMGRGRGAIQPQCMNLAAMITCIADNSSINSEMNKIDNCSLEMMVPTLANDCR